VAMGKIDTAILGDRHTYMVKVEAEKILNCKK
jgi:hypothetical protein